MTTVTTNKSELELHKLLERAVLLSYYDKFIEIGGDNVQQLCDAMGDDFQEVIHLVDMARKPFHVKRLKKALGQWTGQSVTVTSSAADESEEELHELLRLADLLSYHDEFIELGADNVQRLCDSSDEEFQTLAEHVGMARKPLHVKRLKNALKQWSGHSAVMTSIPSNESEREVHELLQRADLLTYYDKFIETGLDNVQQLSDSTEEEFQEFMDLVGMAEFPFHVMRLKDELEQCTGHPGTDPVAQFHLHMERSQQWKDVRKEMHEAIAAKDEARVLKCLDAAPALKLWLDPDTKKSALYKAVEEKALRIHGLLVSRKCALKDDEVSSCYKDLTPVERAEIRRQQYYTTKYEDSYIDYLKSKSRSASGCDDFGVRLEKTFKQLSSDEVNKSILKVVATAPHLDIVFDSVAENVQRITGSGGCSTHGLTYREEERVYVCGSTEKREVWGTLIHELSHMALTLVYTNEGKPYNRGDEEKERHYQQILNDVKGRKNNVHFLIQKAFDQNEEEELIVRIPHILTECDEGNRILELQAPKLLQFFKDTVMPDMQRYILNGIPSIDSTKIENENRRLRKAFHIGQFKVNFEKPLDLSDLQNMPLLVLAGPELSLLEIMVHNTVQSTGQPYLFFEPNQMDDTLKHVLVNYKCRFVLVTVHPKKNVQGIIELLGEVSRVTGTNVMLVVEDSGEEYLTKQVAKDKFFAGKHEVRSIVEANIENVTRDCKEELFKNSSLSLQGEYVSEFPNVMHTDAFLRCLDTSVFLNLCRCKKIDLGPRLHQLEGSVKNYYVERVFTRTVQIDLKACRLDDDKEAFALLKCQHDYFATLVPDGYEAKHQENLKQFEKIVVLQELRDYNALLDNDKYRDEVVHLLRLNEFGNGLLWTKSNGPLSHLPMAGSEDYTTETLLNVPEKVVVVSGAPGMGKSVLASRLCTQLKTQDEKRWVLYVDLLQRMASVETVSPTLEYLANLCQVQKDGLEFVLFEESLNNGSPFEVVVMLDGFDEVNEKCRKHVFDLIQFLANKKVYKVYLLTRTVFKPHVQDTLHTVSYDLIPFSNENQNEFLTRYRAQRETPATSNEAFLQKFQQLYGTLKKKNKTILETPLLLRMMAQIESGEITKSDDYSSLLKIVDISGGSSIYTVHMYKMFVEYKHLVHRKEKVKEDISRSTVRGDNHDAKSPFYVSHGLLAMKCIFPQDILKNLLNEDELQQLDPEGNFITGVDSFKEGFVNRINDGGIPEFVHKTFAEFFAAHYLLEKAKIRKKSSYSEKVIELYGKEEYEGVMVLFDGLASASYPLHSAVINNDASYFEQCDIQTEDMLVGDEIKRTPWHVAALHSDKATLKRLPMDDELIENDLFNMSPLGYVKLFFLRDEEWMEDLWEGSTMHFLSSMGMKKYLWSDLSALRERLNVLYTRCSEEAVKHSTENLRRCETFEQKRRFLERAIFTAVIHDLRGVLDVYLSYVSPRESTVDLDRDIMDQIESRKERSLRCSAEPSVIGNLDDFADSDYKTAPFYAKSELVCKMLLPYCDMGIRDEDGDTMLHNSANEGNLETTQFYLARISINERNTYFQTPLHLAKDAEMVKLLLPLYPSVNVLDCKQQTPMDICAKRDYLEAMKLLLLRTRIYDSHHVRLNTTLHVATYYRSLEAVTFLLPHTNAHMLNYEGETCLDVAWTIWKYHSSVESNTVSCLIPHSIVNSPEMFGSSPLYVWANDGVRKVMQTRWPYLRHSDPRHAQRINRRYVDVNEDFQEEIWCLKLLFLHLDVITGDRYGSKLLHDVAREKLRKIQVNYINYMKMLVPPLNLTEQEKLRKIEVNYINYMKMLLPHLNLTEQDYVECSVGNDDIVTLYRRWSHMNNTDDLHIDDVNAEMIDDDGNIKLLIEAEEGNVDAVKIHLSDSSVCFTDEEENTALHLSARKGHANVAKLLIPLYTSVDVINVYRETPMHVCASYGHMDVVKLLLLRSRMSSRNILGWTPLHLACYSGAIDIVNFLLPHSFPNMRDEDGYTCCALSAIEEEMNVLRYIIPHSLMNCRDKRDQSPMRMCAEDHMRERLVTLLPYFCDYDAASLLTNLELPSCEDDMSIEAKPCLKLMVLHSDVKAVDKHFCATLSHIREYYVESDPFWRPTETEISLLLSYIPLLLPHTNVFAKDDEGKKLLQGALQRSDDPELVSFLQKWTRLSDFIHDADFCLPRLWLSIIRP
ncbi:uncharacterized protein LOC135371357 isoform X2 [Ornithodoros turicata]|uniref:uncharacterized protein LOC135371357 isoform X2 n=1 Tax=Ornithodoros turicata TaxID=34597 RepID=UPI00313A331A